MSSQNYSLIQSSDPKMRLLLKSAENIATSRAHVLIYGESGSGKELLSRFIHARSQRAHQKFVAINCAAIPEGLIESELFGYERGAFTGADQRKIGKFEAADKGTLFLDEVSELPLLVQAKLLRVIQENELERLGSNQTIKINVRLVAASNRNLSELVREKLFREDLFYRLNVVPLQIPPLRSRPKDIDFLSRLFLEQSCAANQIPQKTLTEEGLKKLLNWSWPGNIRELQNVIERSSLLTDSSLLGPSEIVIEGFQEQTKEKVIQPGMTVSEAERWLILSTLETTGQNRTKAAELLGISIRTLRNKINEYKELGL